MTLECEYCTDRLQADGETPCPSCTTRPAPAPSELAMLNECFDCGTSLTVTCKSCDKDRAAAPSELVTVAVAYNYDGYGYQYIDNGSGSDWETRHEGEKLVTRSQAEAREAGLQARIAGLENRAGVAEYKLGQAVNTVHPMLIRRAETAEARIAKLEKYALEATKAITGLTAGGSEYFGKQIGEIFTADLPFCVERIRENMGYKAKAFRAEAQLATCREATKQCRLAFAGYVSEQSAIDKLDALPLSHKEPSSGGEVGRNWLDNLSDLAARNNEAGDAATEAFRKSYEANRYKGDVE